jgi:hypothetical protein
MSIGDELRPVVVFRLVAAAMALRTPYIRRHHPTPSPISPNDHDMAAMPSRRRHRRRTALSAIPGGIHSQHGVRGRLERRRRRRRRR